MHISINKYKSQIVSSLRLDLLRSSCGRVKFATKLSLGLHLLLIFGKQVCVSYLCTLNFKRNNFFLFLRTDNVEGSNSFDNMQKKYMLKFLDINVVSQHKSSGLNRKPEQTSTNPVS